MNTTHEIIKTRSDLPIFFKNLGFKVGAEVGVYRGELTEQFCKADITMYAIDPWTPFVGQGKSEQQQEMQNHNFDNCKKRLSKYENCTIVRKSSMDALSEFGPESLDFVYIDGDHRFRFVAEDISEWYFKIRRGGIVAGHDYYTTAPHARNVICQVKPVVDAFVETYNIPDFYIFGTSDQYLSWMFKKP